MSTPIKDIVFEMRSLEPFPGVAARVLELSGRTDVVPGDLIELVQTDPGITSKVLKLCNSAYFGFQREIASLHEAGNRLGVTTLVNLVMTSSAGKYFRDYGGMTPELLAWHWRRSVAGAIASRLVACKHKKVDPEQAYTAGLLANIGSMVLERHMSDAGPMIRAVAKSGATMIEAEKRTLGLHHAEVSARLATRWGLPGILIDTLRFHHAPQHAEESRELAATAHLGEIVTDRFLAANPETAHPDDSPESPRHALEPAALELTGLSEADLEPLVEQLGTEVAKAGEFLES